MLGFVVSPSPVITDTAGLLLWWWWGWENCVSEYDPTLFLIEQQSGSKVRHFIDTQLLFQFCYNQWIKLILLWSHLERSWVLGSSGRMGWGALSTVSSECP